MLNQRQEAVSQRDAAIARAIDAARSEWAERALWFVSQYAKRREFVTAEDVRVFAASFGLEDVAEPRAWGAVMRTAAKRGLIEKAGYVEAKTAAAHCRPSTLWRSLLTNARRSDTC